MVEFERFIRSLERVSDRKARVFVFKHVCSACDNKRRDPTAISDDFPGISVEVTIVYSLLVFCVLVRDERRDSLSLFACLCCCVLLKCVARSCGCESPLQVLKCQNSLLKMINSVYFTSLCV